MKKVTLLLLLLAAAGALRAQPASFTVSTKSLDFGNVLVGNSVQLTVDLNNTSGTDPLTVNLSNSLSVFTLTSFGDPVTSVEVFAGEATTIEVTFTPTAATTYTDTLVLVGSASGFTSFTQMVSLTGTGILPPTSFSLSDSSVSFGSIVAGTTATRQISVTNTTETNASASFSVSASGPFAASISPSNLFVGQQATITVVFSPGAPGAFNGLLTVTAAASGFAPTSQTVSLSGSATAPQPAPFLLSPPSISFGSVFLGATATQSVTVTNQSPLFQLNFTVGVSGGPFGLGSGSFTLGPQQQATVSVSFSPTAVGPFSGQMTVSASGAGVLPASQTVGLSGTGVRAFTLTPAQLNFGNLLVGCGASMTFNVDAAGPIDFSLEPSDPSLTVSPNSFNGSQTVTVTFSPKTAGSVSGFINVSASVNSANSGLGTTTISGGAVGVTGTGVDFSLAPGSLNFLGLVGAASAPQAVQLASKPSGVTGFAISAASSNPVFASSAVSANGSAQITFTPDAPGAANGAITFSIADPARASCTPLSRRLGVSGTGVSLMLSPASLDFGNVPVGMTSPAQTATLTSSGPVNLSGSAASSNAAFSLSPASFSLPNGGSQAFSVAFKPPAPGAQSGTVNLTLSLVGTAPSSATSLTLGLAVTGKGQTPADLTVAPSQIDFGDVAVGAAVTQAVSVSNPGGTQADVSAAAGAPFTVSAGSFSLAGGGSQSVSIGFTPPSAGPFTGTASFSIAGVTRTVALTGRGVTPMLSYTVTSGANSAEVAPGGSAPPVPPTNVGSSQSVQFQIANRGTVAAPVKTVTIGNPAFALGLPALPASVPAGGTLSFTITFSPQRPGPAAGALNIDAQTFNISGIGLLTGARITGAGGTVQPAQQPPVGVELTRAYDVPITGQLMLSFSPDVLYGDDPLIQFLMAGGTGCGSGAAAGRCVPFTIDAGSTRATFNGGMGQIAFQSGTTAGTIGFQATFQVSGADVTPGPAPTASVSVARAAPVIQSVTASKTSTGLQVVLVGFATTREVNNVTVQFTAASGATLSTTSLTIDVGSQFKTWFSGAGAAYGSLFQLTIPFTLQGNTSAVAKVAVTLSNGDGKSQTVEATVGQ